MKVELAEFVAEKIILMINYKDKHTVVIRQPKSEVRTIKKEQSEFILKQLDN